MPPFPAYHVPVSNNPIHRALLNSYQRPLEKMESFLQKIKRIPFLNRHEPKARNEYHNQENEMEDVTVEEQPSETLVENADLENGAREAQPVESETPSTQELQTQVVDLRSALEQRDTELKTLRHQLTSATARYRESLLAASPEIPEEMVAGATPEEVEASLAQARRMVEQVRSRMESQIAEQRVPAGSPIRSGQDFSGMSTQEKIAYALAQRDS